MLRVVNMLHNLNIVQTVCCCPLWWAAIVLICIISTGLSQPGWLNILVLLPELSLVYTCDIQLLPHFSGLIQSLWLAAVRGALLDCKEARRPALLGCCDLTHSVPLQQWSYCGFSWHWLWHHIRPHKWVTSHQETFNYNLLFHLHVCCKGFSWENSVKATKHLINVFSARQEQQIIQIQHMGKYI